MNKIAIINPDFFEVTEGTPIEEIKDHFPIISDSEIKKYLAMLFTGLKFADKGETNSAMALEVYSMVLEGKSLFAVEAAVKAFLTGVVPDVSKTFVPSTAELTSEVERQFWLHVKWKKSPKERVLEINLPSNHFSRQWRKFRNLR